MQCLAVLCLILCGVTFAEITPNQYGAFSENLASEYYKSFYIKNKQIKVLQNISYRTLESPNLVGELDVVVLDGKMRIVSIAEIKHIQNEHSLMRVYFKACEQLNRFMETCFKNTCLFIKDRRYLNFSLSSKITLGVLIYYGVGFELLYEEYYAPVDP